MNRFAKLLLVLAAFLAEASAKDPAVPSTIVFIVADDLRADVMPAYGGTAKTPHLDRLAGRGSLFTRATCGYPICHVSRTEMITGRCLVAEASDGKAIPFQPGWTLWPELMRQAGWHTVHVGKWHMHGTAWTRGYAETSALYSSGGATGMSLTQPRSATGKAVTGYTGWTLKTGDNKALPHLGVGLTSDTDAHIADGAISAIRKQGSDAPLFLHVNFTAPHDPLHWPKDHQGGYKAEAMPLPPNFRAEHGFDHGNLAGRDERIVPAPRSEEDVRRERAVYFALVEYLDLQVGRILKALEEAGRLESTLVLFTSDHGLALGSHGLMGKQNQYEHTANVPLIIAGPSIPGGRRIEAQCALRDLFPTVCELTGLATPPSVQGQSLVPLLRDECRETREAAFGYFTDTQRMMRTSDGWKLIWYPKAGRSQLFNIAVDPDEMHDLSDDPEHQDRLRTMMERLQRWLRERRAPVISP